MKIIIRNAKDNARTLIRRCGYSSERFDPRNGQVSYAKRLGTGAFPKFHAYLDERPEEVEISLHIDQKQPSYGVGHMHSGEYEGPLVEQELARLRDYFVNAPPPEAEEPPKKKGFFAKIFG